MADAAPTNAKQAFEMMPTRFNKEAAKGLVGDELPTESDRERAGGEDAGGDGVFQDAESVAKPVVLPSEIAREERKAGLSIGQRQRQGYFVN